ncbi:MULTISPECIES: hypothetical protein [Ralstonia solanacearum species complex]|uniref:hypothetical protein n=1 Tax=Ralstonia solanacearum species complex TaxID=3116862 RepID=UPI00078E7A18|nr:hypothetical protein [Ralstonia solanacearum]BEU70765.1 hypothetical protein MAFF211271_03200 [Ralstonia pseudosolanacearum]AMP36354.1 hypothetical protein LBM2029_01830 [Ralstonia solanacearum]AXV75782.1 hypothetical protein CJO76_01615 [Ralstonia solanacearum]AXV85148.1 hypothetical protein CJO78_01915 [Ralstonia solanacearum]AXV89782.1 hypothetical protein CJO79_01615 [Ralstonia solanacearum]
MAGRLAKRANSARPRAPGAGLSAERLARIEAFYRSAGPATLAAPHHTATPYLQRLAGNTPTRHLCAEPA